MEQNRKSVFDFDAFQGHSLQKSTSTRGSRKLVRGNQFSLKGNGNSVAAPNSSPSWIDVDQMWRGSMSNLRSSENITEDLIKESIKDLESAMAESKRMLVERDDEIERLRAFIENNKLCAGKTSNDDEEGEERHFELVNELRETQRENIKLSKMIHEMELNHSHEVASLKNKQQAPPIWQLEDDTPLTNRPECTCYCGTVCKALRDLVEAREHLDSTKTKYENLKKRVKEFKRQTGMEQQNKSVHRVLRDEERISNCSIQ